jgi:hypothetical protein
MYGEPITINELAYADGTYLAHSEKHPNGRYCFKTHIISKDLKSWENVPGKSPFVNIKNVKLFTVNEQLTAVASCKMAEGNKLVAMQSLDGVEWTETFRSIDVSEGYQPITVTQIQGRHIVGCVGSILITSNGVVWNKSTFPTGYETAKVVGSAECKGTFYFLAKMDDRSVIAKTINGETFTMLEIPWSMESITMAGNGEQVVVSCRLAGVACLVYFSDDIKSYKTHILPNNRKNPSHLITVYDMIYFDNQWLFVGSNEFYNVGGMRFSIESFVLHTDGNLTTSTMFTKDITDAKQLEKIRILNNKLVIFGESFPHPASCIYTLEDSDLL